MIPAPSFQLAPEKESAEPISVLDLTRPSRSRASKDGASFHKSDTACFRVVQMRKAVTMVALTVVFGWYVVTYSGERVFGPFNLLDECSYWAEQMSHKYYNVSSVCRYYSF